MKLQEELQIESALLETRRHFLKQCTSGLGMMALGTIFSGCGSEKKVSAPIITNPLDPKITQFAAKAKAVIFLHMCGSPSQLELWDYKPELAKLDGKPCPPSFLEGKKFAFIRGVPDMLGSVGVFKQHGQSGAWMSDYFTHLPKVADEMSFLKAMYTDQFNHAPAQLFMHTGSARLGRPSMGSWVTYGLGSENSNLPGFVVLTSGGKAPDAGKSVWGSGFLPSVYQGVQCRSEGDPVLFLSDPGGLDRDLRKKAIDALSEVNRQQYEEFKDPETLARIAQYEMAFKMQVSVPEVMDISKEPAYIHQLYGTEPGKASFANNCLLARKLVEKGVRFVQLYDWGWDTHGDGKGTSLEFGLRDKVNQIDQAMTALLLDLKQRGMLDETLVVWGTEFGRTPMQENRNGKKMPFKGRDHHTDAFTCWMAGGGVKRGFSMGESDELGYFGVKDRTHIHDLQATILHQLGFDHEKLIYEFQGRNFRLTDVSGKVIKNVIA
ncbi:DUF1501 domain-containing protein [Runella zeae]|uniref:DUF1501 domain-containing protein n=1 Tax=Runella zeae TaxID=94255 RepID=UPI00041A5679|nr:DUF1501 domain-containing protein [Runella zeae]